MGFKLFRTPGVGWFMISVMNMFIKQMLPQAVVRPLSEEEKRRYAEPYPSIASRLPLRQWPLQIPIEGKPAGVHDAISAYAEWLQKTELPKLLFYAKPGGLIPLELVQWCKDHYKNLETVDIGAGLHFIQEDNPHAIGETLSKWYVGLSR